MLRRLPTLAALTTVATLSTAVAEEKVTPEPSKSSKPAVVVSEKASPHAEPTVTGARFAKVAQLCGAESVGTVDPDGAVRCQSNPASTARTGASTLLAGNYSISIPAITCTVQGNLPSGDTMPCLSGATVRVDGDQEVPCQVRGVTARRTYICALNLPAGTQLQEVIAYGMDYSTQGYFEAAIWRTQDAGFAPTYISSFGGTWQSSGMAFNAGYVNFPIFPATQPAHTILAGERYVIGFAARDPNEFTWVGGFRVNYYQP
ncbi:hypothetical protein SAMN05443572_103351 [Myxococcus fulvus]|uniref:Lipoprotein n=1 Tax=Myxococcus fulvus TaxID=33 RepID=A0A511T8K0_MYXFU|nr:hypothetical protein [Myxococcus fulvus]GEN10479.1 hypothetical protein MFU01_55160 [Myxococcus fulvus]SET81687.1 hypothetical protein SAMN05443572_103351 [Myxococcus fulvus]